MQRRTYAGVFDQQVDGPQNEHKTGHSNQAIGGAYGIGWYEYFKDAITGEVYSVRCSDGVNYSKQAYSPEDYEWFDNVYFALITRCREAIESGASVICVSKNERRLMQRWTHAVLLESAKEAKDGVQSSEGLEGGLVGHHCGVPVMCDIALEDRLPERSTERAA